MDTLSRVEYLDTLIERAEHDLPRAHYAAIKGVRAALRIAFPDAVVSVLCNEDGFPIGCTVFADGSVINIRVSNEAC